MKHELSVVANILEKMICTGLYNGRFMCVCLDQALYDKRITEYERDVTTKYIHGVLGQFGLMMTSLVQNAPDDDYIRYVFDEWRNHKYVTLRRAGPDEGIGFERRILLSNAYWRMIRSIRKQVKEMQ